MKIYGPFSQMIPFDGLQLTGPIKDEELKIISDGGVLIEGEKIVAVDSFSNLIKNKNNECVEMQEEMVLLPGFIDAHTHICHAGSRAKDYALRTAGASYLDISKQGGGILDTVRKTRAASKEELLQLLLLRCERLISSGVTTCEVKSGYGLNVDDEIKMLEAIGAADLSHPLDLVPSCLAAHVVPKEFSSAGEYLKYLVTDLLPVVMKNNLSRRVDIFVEEGAFSRDQARDYLKKAKEMGFSVVVHADQFSLGGSSIACEMGAVSADHLEASSEVEMAALAKAKVSAVVLPGSSLGLGVAFAPARQLLDKNCSVVIASDWNPGSAPMGDLITQAALIGVAQKLSFAETVAAMTCRAAHALELTDRGCLMPSALADMVAFPCQDYREILYHQGQMRPCAVWKRGELRV